MTAKVVQELGGWSDSRIVLNTYSHVIPSLKDEAPSKMNSILNPVACPSNTVVVN